MWPSPTPGTDRRLVGGRATTLEPSGAARIEAAPHPRLRPLLARGHSAVTSAAPPDRFVLPASVAVPLVVKLRDSAHRPPEFTTGAHAGPLVMEGACAPAYIEVRLAPLGAYTVLGAPLERLGGQVVDLTGVTPRTAARLVPGRPRDR